MWKTAFFRLLQISKRFSAVNPGGKWGSSVNDNLLIPWATYSRDTAILGSNLGLKACNLPHKLWKHLIVLSGLFDFQLFRSFNIILLVLAMAANCIVFDEVHFCVHEVSTMKWPQWSGTALTWIYPNCFYPKCFWFRVFSSSSLQENRI